MKIIFSFIFITLLLFSQTINEQIHALENANPAKRVALMNSIKQQLINMKQEKRLKIITVLQKKLQVKKKHNLANTFKSKKNQQKMLSKKETQHKKLNQIQKHMINCVNKNTQYHQSMQHYKYSSQKGRNIKWDDNNNNNDNNWKR